MEYFSNLIQDRTRKDKIISFYDFLINKLNIDDIENIFPVERIENNNIIYPVQELGTESPFQCFFDNGLIVFF